MKNRTSAPGGQAVMEYILLIAVVVIALIVSLAVYNSQVPVARNLMEENIASAVSAVQ
ncbi:hypothetical protein HY522_09995 [bacterium]|nr:hypothetical protein [bacterium]